jgi:S1-C subfamily serine protease
VPTGESPAAGTGRYGLAIDLVDLILILAAAIGLGNGYRRGFWPSLLQYAGLVTGVVAGASLAPPVLNALAIGGVLRPLGAILLLVVCGSLGSTFGFWVGEALRAEGRGVRLHPVERLAGSVFSGAAVLAVGWFLGLTFSQGPSPPVARLIQNSAILRTLDGLFPRPPAFLAGVERVLADVPFQTFADLPPILSSPLQPPTSVSTPGVEAAAESVFRVEGRGCGGLVSGSAYPVAPGYLVTNAHVVSGTTGTTLTGGSSPFGVRARVVLFDPQRDVAVLYAPQVKAPPLVPADAGRGTQGAVIGYPGGGDETISPAVIESSVVAEGRDIYNDQLVSRQIWILGAVVRPGDSGGPLVDLQGHVLGLVFAASSTNPDQAYALTGAEVQGDVQQALGRTQGVDTAAYPCAV